MALDFDREIITLVLEYEAKKEAEKELRFQEFLAAIFTG